MGCCQRGASVPGSVLQLQLRLQLIGFVKNRVSHIEVHLSVGLPSLCLTPSQTRSRYYLLSVHYYYFYAYNAYYYYYY